MRNGIEGDRSLQDRDSQITDGGTHKTPGDLLMSMTEIARFLTVARFKNVEFRDEAIINKQESQYLQILTRLVERGVVTRVMQGRHQFVPLRYAVTVEYAKQVLEEEGFSGGGYQTLQAYLGANGGVPSSERAALAEELKIDVSNPHAGP